MSNDGPCRDRFEAALQRKKHDRVPVLEFIIDRVNLCRLVDREVISWQDLTPDEMRDIHCRFGFDVMPALATPPFYTFPAATEQGNFKEGGINTIEDVKAAALPAKIENVVADAQRQIEFAAEKNMGVWAFVFGPFTSVYCGMGIDRFWMKTCEDPALIEAAFDKANDYCVDVVAALSELDLTAVVFADDVAYNDGLMLQPQAFRELWYPRTEKVLAAPKAKGIPIIMHSCGNWRDLLPLADELGVDCIEPLQPTCNDIYQIKKDWGERFCIMGNIDIAGVLAFGTPDETRADVREHIDRLAGDGGYIVHSSHSITDAVKHENFLAMNDEARSYGRYR